MGSHTESVEQIFMAALSLEPDARKAFLDEACKGDANLKHMVESLLLDNARAGIFLENPLFELRGRINENAASNTICINDSDITDETLPSALAHRFSSGDILNNRFTVVRFIAGGGMGEVYEVEDRFLQSVHVALKTILPRIADDPLLQQRFEREVLLARSLNHPNLCPIYDIFRCEHPPPAFSFLTMKLLHGETLAARFRRESPLLLEDTLAILKQLVAGVSAMHAGGVVHRDIKSNNIMLEGAGPDVHVFITDFGLARAHESEATVGIHKILAGTPSYMAPELFLGRSPSRATDLFALGVVLHELFLGKKPVPVPDTYSVVVSPQLNSLDLPSYCVRLVSECLSDDPQRRCQAFDEAHSILDRRSTSLLPAYSVKQYWTRRRFLTTAAGAAFAAAGGAWWKHDALDDLLHPLPPKRFIALLNWPKTSDSRIAPMLTGVLSAIQNELARLEAFDRDLFVISPEEVPQQVPPVAPLREVCDPLGANLALAASGVPGAKHFELTLRLLDPVSNRLVRKRTITCRLAEITSLPAEAVRAAASLLNLSRYLQGGKGKEPGTQSTAAFTAFQSAETLRKQPNDTGLDAAIEKYKEAVDLDPRYAMAHAMLAEAYVRQYGIQHNSSALELARGNSNRALALEPGLVEGHLARSLVLEYMGDEHGALNEITNSLTLDSSNPKALLWQAEIYDRLNRWSDAEKAYRRILNERPNSWVTYNEFGCFLQEQGRFQEAVQAFRAASAAAPGSAFALGSLGIAYLETGDFDSATESLKKSLALAPNTDYVFANISLAFRYQGKYADALPYALKAVQLGPGNDANWLELGDCYSSLHNRKSEALGAYRRAAKEAERHLQTDQTNGPSWMLLALYRVKSGSPQEAPSLIQKAESLGAGDMDSQLYKSRILEQLGKRNDALATLAACFQKGASALQIAPFPDMQALRKDPRYRQMVQSKAATAGYLPAISSASWRLLIRRKTLTDLSC